MNDINKHLINNAINAVLEEHVAATRSQRTTIRELILDAIEQAGFEIVQVNIDNSDIRPVLTNEQLSAYMHKMASGLVGTFGGYVDPGVTASRVREFELGKPAPDDYNKAADAVTWQDSDQDLQALMDRDRE